MTLVKFKVKSSAYQNEKFIFPLLFVVFSVLAVLDIREVIHDGNWMGWNVLKGSLLAMAAIGVLTGSIRVICFGSADQNNILLDGEGLSLLRWGQCKKWSWQELPSFQVTKSFISGIRIISFAVPGAPDWRTRIGAWLGTRVSSGKLAIVIADVYDSSIEEIATCLNKYRDRALTSAGPESA